LALACNIDPYGRTIRYRIGFTLLALGALACALAAYFGSRLGFALGGLLVAGGLFSLFEANRGWCAARALGFRTKF
jgi:apolipoprotein N-acyltransferase